MGLRGDEIKKQLSADHIEKEKRMLAAKGIKYEG